MRTRFMHIADCHLGYRQYNLNSRHTDFGRAFVSALLTAIEARVDFVLLAGDLFHKRAIDALTLNQAMFALEKLKKAGIPCVGVEGNHEHAYYDESMGWMKFLAMQELLVLLDPDFEDGKPLLKAYAKRSGSYFEPIPKVRVHGMRYMGFSTPRAIEGYATALAELPQDGVEYTIFVTHAGLEGEVANQAGGLSPRQLGPLRPHVDYLALGHIHKPYERDGWIYNPGSLETCSIQEAAWDWRGYYLVEVDTANGAEAKHHAQLKSLERRQFLEVRIKVDLFGSPEQLMDGCASQLARKALDAGVGRLGEDERPVVIVNLSGVLAFDRSQLEVRKVEQLAHECFDPLYCQVNNLTKATVLDLDEDSESMSRPLLERRVLADLFTHDERYRGQADQWARLAIGLKDLVLEGASPEAVVEELEQQMAQINTATEQAPHAYPLA
jgi:DNA repair protein SbcD/Mre11